MDLTPFADNIRRELLVAAEAGGDEARALAERLTAPLDSALRITLLDALSAAADEITRDLAPGSVELRLRGRDPQFVVTAPPSEPSTPDPGWSEPPETEEGPASRISLRLPEQLKIRVEEVAGRDGLSVNAWLVRAVATAVDRPRQGEPGTSARRTSRGPQHFTGWVQ
ncbi:hypothetical protein G4X40_10280 [Rhodococcus sp. D2-41]|uniref:Histidine kinase n=1 Tax=Speluncibacter jeojiensis TaxID=2710754 RepID=A0A9X4M304_9ACTN|nr:hypothetical protein [Rhodococcus sp. D2-41]MDG3010534.1 hypothetical protein [Rhodococcus sp. D2-41]MDG3014283.1 hypothetical protein [Corynebacteriales bacterium D3-21]